MESVAFRCVPDMEAVAALRLHVEPAPLSRAFVLRAMVSEMLCELRLWGLMQCLTPRCGKNNRSDEIVKEKEGFCVDRSECKEVFSGKDSPRTGFPSR
jgi:hypothetical protein